MTQIAERDHALDGLRGISALVVVIWHVYCLLLPLLSFATIQVLHQTPASFFLGGTQAVVCFFILSGFVLTQATKKQSFSWKEYYPKRILRLYLPVLASYILAALLILVIPRNFSSYPNYEWLTNANYEHITLPLFINNLLFTDTALNNPTWSIVYEIIFSLTLPLWLFVLNKTKPFIAGIAIAIFFILIWVGISYHNETLTWYPVFGLGILLSIHIETIRSCTQNILHFKHHKWVSVAVILTGVAFFSLPGETNAPTRFLTAIGAFILVLGAITTPWFKTALEGKITLFLGKISFGLYLVHTPIIVTTFLVMPTGYQLYSPMISIPVSILVAYLFTKIVDEPSILLSRKIGRKVQQTKFRKSS